ncbi:hypothetical protein [Celeribacter indicus]|uniref:Uncharacterized protein n=1 Tax=Celeribacter indicus TaxID=1208324 RepID=A0A0B5DYE7_9RHOB|nr:hypothetical protein [Celeribacter indicus]AJE48034.1 hypothetical protein P73_3319 [Celeribacter indicus]SDW30088.1 hypothetical protein SAMN05443573_102312 [Celeribacter indicus]
MSASPRSEAAPADLILSVSPARRVVACLMLLLLGALLVWVVLRPEGIGPGYGAMLLVLAAGAVWLALALWLATARRLVLTGEALVEEGSGRLLCRLDDIARVERGTFAFKPSNGFLLRLKTPGPRVWAPGLWWRIGRRIGVGGVTPASQAKAMADVIAARVAGAGRLD